MLTQQRDGTGKIRRPPLLGPERPGFPGGLLGGPLRVLLTQHRVGLDGRVGDRLRGQGVGLPDSGSVGRCRAHRRSVVDPSAWRFHHGVGGEERPPHLAGRCGQRGEPGDGGDVRLGVGRRLHGELGTAQSHRPVLQPEARERLWCRRVELGHDQHSQGRAIARDGAGRHSDPQDLVHPNAPR